MLRRTPHSSGPPLPGAPFSSPYEFRTSLAAVPPSSPARFLPGPGSGTIRFVATPAGGDCGFFAVSWALQGGGHGPSPTDLRNCVSNHVSTHAVRYAQLLLSSRLVSTPAEAHASVFAFIPSVRRGGPSGHWLGAMWGDIELIALARALDLRLELYTFDVTTQSLRLYASFDEGKCPVALLFSGRAEAGHFDLLMPHRTIWQLIRSLIF